MQITFHMRAWSAMNKKIVDEKLVPKAKAIAEQCNSEAGLTDDGYIAGTESYDGGPALRQHGYRATVITRSWEAQHDNAVNDRLVSNFHLAEGLV